MLHKIYRISIDTLTHVKSISLKRVFILFLLMLFIGSVTLGTLFLSEKESVAYMPEKQGAITGRLQAKGIDIREVFNDQYKEISERDKELAYVYLRKKFKGRNVSFFIHKIKRGENFWGIAKRNGVNIDTIVGANPELNDLIARTGKEIIILSKTGVLHEVRDAEESLEMLSQLYSVTMEKILAYNDIKNNEIKVGDVLFIRRAKPVYMSESLKSLFYERKLFRSPISGVYTSLFGPRVHPITGQNSFHEGVDIRAKIGTWVGAAADGKVIYSGWAQGWGHCVRIKHKDGFVSVYAHLSKRNVKTGQKVKSGKLIAKTGKSGRATGPHLHFGIYKNGRPHDPLKYIW